MNDDITGQRVDVTLTLDVPRPRLWELITDVSRIGEWSPECVSARWLDPMAPGARFEGHNRYPNGQVASATCVVTEVVRPSVFAWVVLDGSGHPDRPAAIWRYELLPGDTPEQTVVRHSFEHGPGGSGARAIAAERDPGMVGRLAQLRHNMITTLTAMAASADLVRERS
jgi:uncharacterized protein YndB with AHSA1/START domain